MSEIDTYMNAYADVVHRLMIRMLSILGEKCVIEARDRSPEASWNDQTGNLRSSIGYVVVCNGKIVQTSAFDQVKNGTKGPQEGKNLAESLAAKFTKGYALIVVAGMNYAEYVEAMDNKVVLTSAELLANRELPVMMQKLKRQIAAYVI